jgi:phosphate transport system protein
MTLHLSREIEKLKNMLSTLSAHVEESVQRAVASVLDRDVPLAESVIAFDPQIDQMEVDVEEECLKILALHQPVAADLRFIVASLKLNNDLERIGDLAVNIAELGRNLAVRERVDIPYDLRGMVGIVRGMLRDSLDALMGTDAGLARDVRMRDDSVDAINRQMYPDVQAAIRANPEHIESLIRLLRVSHNLERIADHATNIAEDVIYMVEGGIVRHRSGE